MHVSDGSLSMLMYIDAGPYKERHAMMKHQQQASAHTLMHAHLEKSTDQQTPPR